MFDPNLLKEPNRRRPLSTTLLIPPAFEPLSLNDAKIFLRVDHDDDDDVISALISAARAHVEAQTRRALITQTWRLARDGWPITGQIKVRPAPVQSIATLRTYDHDGDELSHDPSIFAIDVEAGIIAAPPWSLPVPGRSLAGIEIDFVAGFGNAASAVPAPLLQAIRHLVAHWYDNRGLVALGSSLAIMPASVGAMISSYRVMAL
jgi:uncharacterized phiE125 gp8 family phage protein